MWYNTETEWTTEQLINMSESLAQAYCPGLVKLTVNQNRQEEQNWKTFFYFF